ncbi:NAD(P)/FAD-dependent oxidoreductase [Foetidibacter luteolus]|uniref:NAD(P)/FAD-dependent oxidoreductase n=1 Tax=Foetidibacter luteolus TaxID=2608880 RepID=UPI00129B27AC|nr:NAD(P)/FAD-dependent oxidoreductase [Foetidibacter luteolus]
MSKHIIVVGGGFAGLNLVSELLKEHRFHITLVDKNNYSFFPPLLYQLATGFLETSNISYPYRKHFRNQSNVRFHMGELVRVLPDLHEVVLSTGVLHYDYLVIATGGTTNFFGMERVSSNALPLKTVNDALELRNHILSCVELAAVTSDRAEREKLLTIVIAGAGPTGVEVAGMLSEMRAHVFPKDFAEIERQPGKAFIYLADGSDAVLKPMSLKSQADTFHALEKLGVALKLGVQVKDYDGGTILFNNGETIEAATLVWAAGITGKTIEGIPEASYGRSKRLMVDPYNSVEGLEDVFAIGDASIQLHEPAFPKGHPQLAQVAIQQGKNLAINLAALQKGKPLKPFAYRDKGSMAIIGRNKAVTDLPSGRHFKGWFAWYMWLFVHLASLLTRRNRLTTLFNWAVAFFTSDQALRMIIRPSTLAKKYSPIKE